jgi:hypothetical protein
MNLTDKIQNNSLDLTLKNISSITKKEEFVINNDIQNSLFPSEDKDFNQQDYSIKPNDIISSNSYVHESELSKALHDVFILI